MIGRGWRRVAIVAAILVGTAVTSVTARFGYAGGLFQALQPGCRPHPLKAARIRVLEVVQGIHTFLIDNDVCPTRDQLIEQKYVARGVLTDPWGTSLTFHCTPDGDAIVLSAGPDRLFHTADDITDD